jgi:uncharacterized protein (TIGR01244 family)
MKCLVTPAIALVLSVPVFAQQKMDKPGITNYTKVDAIVACGGATETSALTGLKADGVTSIVNLRLADERGANIPENEAQAKTLGLKYFHLPLSGASPDPKVIDRFISIVGTKANQPVYVHCGSANRVGAVWLAKRVVQDGWPVDKAAAEAKAIGLTSPALEKFAMDYIAAHKK